MAGQVLVSLFCELNNYLCHREKSEEVGRLLNHMINNPEKYH